MYGLIITTDKIDGDIIKVSSSKEKLYMYAEEYIMNYVEKNNISKKSPQYINLLEALKIKEFDAVMEFFGAMSEKINKPSFMALAKVDFIYDS